MAKITQMVTGRRKKETKYVVCGWGMASYSLSMTLKENIRRWVSGRGKRQGSVTADS
jgi:hypothetical protein